MLAHRFSEGAKRRVLASLAGSATCKSPVSSSIGSPRKPRFLLDQTMGEEIFIALGAQCAERIAGLEIGIVRVGPVRLGLVRFRLVCFGLVCFGLVCLLKRFETSAPRVGVDACRELQFGGGGIARPIEAARVAGAQGALGEHPAPESQATQKQYFVDPKLHDAVSRWP